jgi:polysaccharide export outer membrane protein
MKRVFLPALLGILTVSALAFGIQKPAIVQGSVPAVSPAKQVVADDFVIGPEDVLAISVWREPELSVKDIIVRPDGKLSLPLVNDIQASGLTPRQLQMRLAERLKEFIDAPNVTVVVTKIESQAVSIVGKVSKPGVYPLGAPMTVLELLARSGGFQEEAKTKRIRIVRNEGGRTTQFAFNYSEVSAGKNLKQNITLKNGDVVIVP